MPEEDKVFLVGLTMAGAVSAGAYTAGVLDYLFRAIDAHNARARRGPTEDDPEPPRHRVVIKVMSGASAGGMCTGLALAGLLKNRAAGGGRLGAGRAIDYTDADGATARCTAVLEPLFEAWVENIKLWDGEDGLLATRDMSGEASLLGAPTAVPEEERPVYSVLDSSHVDRAAIGALKDVPPLGDDAPYDFLASDLDLFVTTTDLNGVVYRVGFARNEYRMNQHGSARHFRVSGLGRAGNDYPSAWLDLWRDRGIALDPKAQHEGRVPFVSNRASPWYALTVGAVASGAFPVGLAPRSVAATAAQMGAIDPGTGYAEGGALTVEFGDTPPAGLPRPDFAGLTGGGGPAPYVAVDGGVINNEPFELARYTLRRGREGGGLHANPRGGQEADRAVIMIDPFPETPSYSLLKTGDLLRLGSLLPSLLALFPALIQQVRFKLDALLLGGHDEVHSRFLIAPERDATADKPAAKGADAIACGALGGFSGFFARDFRLHDFVLGQRNCQRFVEAHFTLHADNAVLGLGEDHPDAVAARDARGAGRPLGGAHCRRIVDPGTGDGFAPVSTATWPRVATGDLRRMLEQLETRLTRIGGRVFDVEGVSGRNTLARVWKGIPLIYPNGLQGDATAAIGRAVLTAFVLRGQHEAYAGFAPAERYAIVKLIAAGDEARTAAELRRALLADEKDKTFPEDLTVPTEAAIERLLQRLVEKGLAARPWNNLFQPFRYRHFSG